MLHYTPPAVHEHIDFSHFRKSDTAFVSGRFGVSFSDVVYETRLDTGAPARLLFLFEHKSYVPRHPVYLQLLDYLLQIWGNDVLNNRKLSFIIPIVVYHGDRSWEQKPFSDYFHGLPEHWKVFVPNFHYLLTDLSRMPEQAILEKRESEYLRNLFLALKSARDERIVQENWEKIFTFEMPFDPDDRGRILFQALIFYIAKLFDMPQAEIQKRSKNLTDLEKTFLENLDDLGGGWLTKAKKKEREEQIRQFTLKTLQKFPDWSDAEVADFVGVTEQYVQQIRQELEKGQ